MLAPETLVAIVAFFSPANEVIDKRSSAIQLRLVGLVLHLTIYILLVRGPDFSPWTPRMLIKYPLMLLLGFERQEDWRNEPALRDFYRFALCFMLPAAYGAVIEECQSCDTVQRFWGVRYAFAFFAFTFGITLRNGPELEGLSRLRRLVRWYPNAWRMPAEY
ncbi:hypothetical protein MKEN_00028700 [Mycena kentingensis (nom. inval.)]|nr:hypothetical protein MKEN_00028700 [Mycena kentingensis (nom. inval.)]